MKSIDAEIIYENTIQADFVRRLNRFTAEVFLEGRIETVHVKNTGRLGELLIPRARVMLQNAAGIGRQVSAGQKAAGTSRKTAYDLISVYRPGLSWVNVDSLAPNLLVKKYLTGSCMYDSVRPEYAYGDSRIDFYMERGKERYLTEVKGCTLLSEDPSVGLFPDAPTERGVKHLRELAKAAGEGFCCSIAFVIQMNGVTHVMPNDGTQPEFGRALHEAIQAGVRVHSLACAVEADRIRILKDADETERYR